MTEPQHTITDLVIHKLIKDRHGAASIELQPDTCPLTDPAIRLVERLCRHYAGRPGKGYGRFEENDGDFPVPRVIRQHVLLDEWHRRAKLSTSDHPLADDGWL